MPRSATRNARARNAPGRHARGAKAPREPIGHEQPGSVLRGPPISITCACGQRNKLRYGETWTCEQCSRVWDTSTIPRDEYEAIRRITWRFRLLPVVLGLLVATVALFFVLTGNPTSVFVLLPLALMVWFTYLRGVHRRRYLAALAERKQWRLDGR